MRAQKRYEGRKDLSNIKRDGKRYLGRGIFQLTGRANYRGIGTKRGLPLEATPELAALPRNAVVIAAQYWSVTISTCEPIGWFKGTAHNERKWQTLSAMERAEQDHKIKESDERAFVTIDRLNTEMEKRDALIAQLEELARRDPAARRLCLSIDSVRRINRARSR